jgi:SAM-dependent methyltransferase
MPEMSLAAHRRDWEELATIDAKWSVLTGPGKRNAWEDSEFFATGECEIRQLLQTLQGFGYPKLFKSALDFGCGVGRLTQALSQTFENTWGVDISARMLEQAKANVPRASFVLNDTSHLSFADGAFDLVYTAMVLQHLPHPRFIVAYIGEFLRVIGSRGIAVFHVPTYVELIHRVQPRRRLYTSLRACGMDPGKLVSLNLTPMRVIALSENRILEIVRASSCRVIHVDNDSHPVRGAISKTFYVASSRARASSRLWSYACPHRS